jgi:murein DD-endopeptidase MepM/ murein hydrolase activator NlpD
MNDFLHIVVTSVLGKTHGIRISRRRLKIVAGSFLAAISLLAVVGIVGVGLTVKNLTLHNRLSNLQQGLDQSQALNDEYREQLAMQEQEKEELMKNALAELDQRSKAIESILSTVGVDINIEESSKNAGGPYASPTDKHYEDLTLKVDQYLETIQFIPLGAPLPGTITSKYGRRPDPFTGEMAHHAGIDIKNFPGAKIMATADGVVTAKGYNSSFGNYVVIDHGNDFQTRFMHLQKSIVNQGNKVSRGQVIGLLGSTGRSTGPHLHYEIIYHHRQLDPLRFMRTARYISMNERQSSKKSS